ncbi:DUF1566 domain-containing protein [bacterium]|nr:DUF1566 domain-containing protein [bacterium]
MKFKALILFIIFSLFLISCESKNKWINTNDPEADQAEISKICSKYGKECGVVDMDYKGVSFEMDCGECSDGYECRFNTCWDIDECDDPTLNNCPIHSDCHNLDMESDGQPYECICKDNYSGDDCVPDTRLKDCEDLPDGAMWNRASRIEQTWNGTDWTPSNKGTFDETSSSNQCRYKCKQNYTWTGTACKADSRTANCTGLPANAEWNTASSIEQTWNGEDWTPSTKGTYNESKSSKECHFKCKNNFEWNGSECVDKTEINDEDSVEDEDDDLHDEDADSSVSDDDIDTTPITPCDPNPCNGIANSTNICTVTENGYTCGCDDGFFWNGSECKKQITLGNICTGQTRCYNNTEEITCPTSSTADFYGQDAQYAKAGYCYPQSFTVKTVSGKNIVVDNNTGLVWEQSPSEDTYTWDNRETHCNELNSSNYAGIDTWRVPNPLELRTIVDNNKFNPATNFNFTEMPTNNSTHFWTSKEYKGNTTYAYFFSPSYGWDSYNGEKSNTYKVLCVSGKEFIPAVASDFETSSDGTTVTDKQTGLMWQKEYASNKTWQEALKFCEDSTDAGYYDWRLPNKNELASLVNHEKLNSPYSYFQDMPSNYFWSSSTNVSNIYGRLVGFEFGNIHSIDKAETSNVRCVRSERINDPCNPNPCNGLANSTQTCTQHNAFEYSCGCNNGYFWNGQKCAVLPECSTTSGTPCKDSTSHLIWSTKAENTMTWQDAKNYCISYTEGGFSSWHLPNIDELMTIFIASRVLSCQVSETNDHLSIDYWTCKTCTEQGTVSSSGNGCSDYGTLYDDGRYSKLGETKALWSSSIRSGITDYAWNIKFDYGYVSSNPFENSRYARCVRCEDGYYWNGQKCAVLPECSATSGTPCKDSTSLLIWSKKAEDAMTWQDAKNYCSNYIEGGLTGWHLPNIDELRTIFIADRASACQLSETNNCLSMSNCWSCETCTETGTAATSGNTCSNWGTSYSDGRYSKLGESGWFWSSSTGSASSNNAFGISFNVGALSDYARSYDHDVRCVRK